MLTTFFSSILRYSESSLLLCCLILTAKDKSFKSEDRSRVATTVLGINRLLYSNKAAFVVYDQQRQTII